MERIKDFLEKDFDKSQDSIHRLSDICIDVVSDTSNNISFEECLDFVKSNIIKYTKGKSSIENDEVFTNTGTSSPLSCSSSICSSSTDEEQTDETFTDTGISSTDEEQTGEWVSGLDTRSIREYLLSKTQINFTQSMDKKFKEHNLMSKDFFEKKKIKRAMMYIESFNDELGVTFIDCLENLGGKLVKMNSNTEQFKLRMTSNLDFGEIQDPFDKKIEISNYYYEKNYHRQLSHVQDLEQNYSWKINRSVDFILDIFIPKNLSWIELRDSYGNLIASCHYNYYDKIDKSVTNDPYILENYRRANLFENVLPVAALPYNDLYIVYPFDKDMILLRCCLVNSKYRRFICQNFNENIKFIKKSSFESIKKTNVTYYDGKKFFSTK